MERSFVSCFSPLAGVVAQERLALLFLLEGGGMGKGMVVVLLFVLLGSGCQPREAAEPNTSLTHGMVKGNVVKGKTRQVELLEMFGGPNVMTTNKSGETVWTYNRISSSSSGRQENLYLFVYSSSGFSGSSRVRSFTFIITFDEQDVVKDYSVRTSQY